RLEKWPHEYPIRDRRGKADEPPRTQPHLASGEGWFSDDLPPVPAGEARREFAERAGLGARARAVRQARGGEDAAGDAAEPSAQAPRMAEGSIQSICATA